MSTSTHTDAEGNEFNFVEEDGMVYNKRYVNRMRCGGLRQQLEYVRDMEIRDDDLFIAAYAKSGRIILLVNVKVLTSVSFIVNETIYYNLNKLLSMARMFAYVFLLWEKKWSYR